MKKLFLLVFLFISFFCKAQERKSIAISYGAGVGDFGSFYKTGYQSNKGMSLNIIGFNYSHEIAKSLFFETGILLIDYNYINTSMGFSLQPTNHNLKMISVPFKLRFEAGKYIFFNGGLMADLEVGKDSNIRGIGAGIGLGLQLRVAKKISIFANPQTNIHNLIFLVSRQKLAELNVGFGLAYQIK